MSETLVLASGAPSVEGIGEIIGGKYRLERELGRGAMGTVWSAVHLTLGQRVAIKLISAEHSQSVEARQRFSTEAKAAARLKSRYAVAVYDDGETATGTPYIVLEYLEGETLEQRIDRERVLPLNDAVRVTRHVARALSRAHAQGIVHRDLKPGNVFLTKLDEEEYGWIAKVLDFGIAKLEEHGRASTTRAGTVLGTPLFMSPEQVRGASQVDPRADLYSLGMVFYNMLTGSYAFTGDNFSDILIAICTQPLPELRERAPAVPVSVGAWFQKACAREAADRFQSADEMLEALEMAVGVTGGGSVRSPLTEQRPAMNTLRGYSPPVEHTRPRGPMHTPAQGASGTQVLVSNPVNLHPGNVTAVDPTLRSAGAHGRGQPEASGAQSTFAVHHLEESSPPRPRTRIWVLAAVVGLLGCALGLALFARLSSGSSTPAASALPSAPLAASVAAPPSAPTPPPAPAATSEPTPATATATAEIQAADSAPAVPAAKTPSAPIRAKSAPARPSPPLAKPPGKSSNGQAGARKAPLDMGF